MIDYLQNFDVMQWVSTLGYVGIMLIVLVETGLFFGFFLPGDSLVFSAGLLAARGVFDIRILVPILVITAFVGYSFGYWFGKHLGKWLLARPESFFFKKKYLIQAQEFYARHGGKALILGRMVPVVRTFAPIVAGMARMDFRKYQWFNFAGAIVWGGVITLCGYYLGGLIPGADKYILPLVILIIFLSVLPGVWHYLRQRTRSKSLTRSD